MTKPKTHRLCDFRIWSTLITVIFILFNTDNAFGEKITFSKDVTYQVEGFDDEPSVRPLALERVRRLLFEDLYAYLSGNSAVQSFKLSKDQMNSLAAGSVAIDISSQSLNGKSYHLAASITADTAELVEHLDRIRRNQLLVQDWENTWIKAFAALKEAESMRRTGKKRSEYEKALNILRSMDWFYKGYVNLRQKNHELAIEAFNNTIHFDPSYKWAYNSRGVVYLRLGRYQEALGDFKKEIEINPKSVFAYYNQGDVLYKLSDFQGAIIALDKVIELEPKEPAGFNSRGWLYYKTKNYELALKDFNTAISLNPAFEKAYFNLGLTYEALGEYQKEIASYNRIIELNPMDASAYSYRGWAYYLLGDKEQALKDQDKSIEIDPSFSGIHQRRGIICKELGKYEQALVSFNKSIDLRPDGWSYISRGHPFKGHPFKGHCQGQNAA